MILNIASVAAIVIFGVPAIIFGLKELRRVTKLQHARDQE
jgi:hypothetical protein